MPATPATFRDIPTIARKVARDLDPEGTWSQDELAILERALLHARQEGRELAKGDDPTGALHAQRRAYKNARNALAERARLFEDKLEAVRDILINNDINDKGKIIVALGIINDTLIQSLRR